MKNKTNPKSKTKPKSTVFSLRLDPELTALVRNRAGKSMSESDVIRDAIQHYFDDAQRQQAQHNYVIESSKKSIISYRILETIARKIFDGNEDLLDNAIARGLQDSRKSRWLTYSKELNL